MIRLTLKIEALEFDKEAFTRASNERLKQQLKIAGQLFYKAAIKLVPVRTGFAAGAFANLAEAVGLARVAGIPSLLNALSKHPLVGQVERETGEGLKRGNIEKALIQALQSFREGKPGLLKPGRHVTRNNRKIPDEYYRPRRGVRILKTPSAARDDQLSTPVDKVITKIGDNGYKFTYAINIIYFTVEDIFGHHSPSAPWKSMESGEAAFERYMFDSARLRDLFPNIDTFYRKRVYTVNNTSVTQSTEINT